VYYLGKTVYSYRNKLIRHCIYSMGASIEKYCISIHWSPHTT
jgi:hypothetical protein